MSSARTAQASDQFSVQQRGSIEQIAEAQAGTLQPGVPLAVRQFPVSGVTPGALHSVRLSAVVTQMASQFTSQQ